MATSERVTDETLAEVERLCAALGHTDASTAAFAYRIGSAERLVPLAARLAASERARREEDAAIGRLLDEAGITPREGETLRARVERLIEDANATAPDGRVCDRELANDEPATLTTDSMSGPDKWTCHACEYDAAEKRAEKAEADLAALRAPVDVEEVLEADRRAASRRAADARWLGKEEWKEIARPHIERAAQLARENEALREQVRAEETVHAPVDVEGEDVRCSLCNDTRETQGRGAKHICQCVLRKLDIARRRADVLAREAEGLRRERDAALSEIAMLRGDVERLTAMLDPLSEAAKERARERIARVASDRSALRRAGIESGPGAVSRVCEALVAARAEIERLKGDIVTLQETATQMRLQIHEDRETHRRAQAQKDNEIERLAQAHAAAEQRAQEASKAAESYERLYIDRGAAMKEKP